MDIKQLLEEIYKIKTKYPMITIEELKHLKLLSQILSVECHNFLYDLGKLDKEMGSGDTIVTGKQIGRASCRERV